MSKIFAKEGKIIVVAVAIRDAGEGTVTLEDAAKMARGKIEFIDELFDPMCALLGNPDLFFDLA